MEGIPILVLKNSPDNILTAYSHGDNLSLSHGIFFSSCRTAKVIPVFKKGCLTDVNNYRTICETAACKISLWRTKTLETEISI